MFMLVSIIFLAGVKSDWLIFHSDPTLFQSKVSEKTRQRTENPLLDQFFPPTVHAKSSTVKKVPLTEEWDAIVEGQGNEADSASLSLWTVARVESLSADDLRCIVAK